MIFTEQPFDFNKEIEVVACYIEHEGKFVLLHRHEYKTNGGKWGLPAGKIDKGETKEQAMIREIREETGIEIPVDRLIYFNTLYVRNMEHDLEYHTFSTVLNEVPSIQLSSSEHQNYVWVTPAQSLEMNLIHDLADCIKLFYSV